MLKILYVHGYLGSGNGNSSRRIKSILESRGAEFTLDAPQFPVTNHAEMKKKLQSLIDSNGYDWVVASSMGGFYTLCADAPQRILVNPAMPENLLAIREKDPENNPELTDGLLKELEQDREDFLKNGKRKNLYIIFGTRDTIAPNESYVRKICPEAQAFTLDMEHRLDENGAEKVCDIILGEEK